MCAFVKHGDFSNLYTMKPIYLILAMSLLFSCTAEEPLIETPEEMDEWTTLKLAIIKTESEYDSTAVGRSRDIGLFQITPVYVAEVNRLLGQERFIHEDAFDTIKANEMFEILQAFRNPEHDIDKAIRLHNGGSAYARKVKDNMSYIRTYESVKRVIN